MSIYYYEYQAPFGAVGLELTDQKLSGVDLCLDCARVITSGDNAIDRYCRALDDYFSGKRKAFNEPIIFTGGTQFQNNVWQQIAAIDFGCTRTYGEIAKDLNSHARAVGQACGRNPVPLFVPCHRVLAKSGLGGFNLGKEEKMLQIKTYLLTLEGVL